MGVKNLKDFTSYLKSRLIYTHKKPASRAKPAARPKYPHSGPGAFDPYLLPSSIGLGKYRGTLAAETPAYFSANVVLMLGQRLTQH